MYNRLTAGYYNFSLGHDTTILGRNYLNISLKVDSKEIAILVIMILHTDNNYHEKKETWKKSRQSQLAIKWHWLVCNRIFSTFITLYLDPYLCQATR